MEYRECVVRISHDEIVVDGIPADLETVWVFGIFWIGEGDRVLGFVAFFV